MKKLTLLHIFLAVWTLLGSPVLWAQPHYAQVLRDVEEKNPTLLAAAKRSEAKQAAVHVGALINDPKEKQAILGVILLRTASVGT